MIWIIIGIVVLIAGIIGVIFLVRFGLKGATGSGDVQLRLEEYAGRSAAPLSLEEIELSQPFTQRVIRPTPQPKSSTLSILPAWCRATADAMVLVSLCPDSRNSCSESHRSAYRRLGGIGIPLSQ